MSVCGVICRLSLLSLRRRPFAQTPRRCLLRHLPHGGGMLVIALALFSSAAHAQPAASDVTSKVGFDQKLGAKLPLEARFRDRIGTRARAGRAFRSTAGDPGAGVLRVSACSAARF